MTLGSLFDGSGGFPLAGCLNGITPVWASEIEKYQLAVTKARFPEMKQLGDILTVRGNEIDPVDIITFGSPCQDMSVAGMREGLGGSRSTLFYEAIRIIKEMRETTNGRYPRYAVWENVPGAFSSSKGYDFYEVLKAFCSIADDTLSVPEPKKNRDRLVWGKVGYVECDGASIAWRTMDAQYWGVLQRRRRIYLVADFAGRRAGEILFDPEGVRWDSAQGGEAREGTARDTEEGTAGADGNVAGFDLAQITSTHNHSSVTIGAPQPPLCGSRKPHVIVSGFNGWRSAGGTIEYEEERAPCVQASMPPNVIEAVAIDCRNDRVGAVISTTLQAKKGSGYSLNYTNPVCYTFQGYGDYKDVGIAATHRAAHDTTTANLVVCKNKRYIVRRLTPVECARLQGFPDWWGDIDDKKLQSDSAQYRMWGNGIALPCAAYVLRGIAKGS